ncbi:hypothetical protein [Algibacter lectus]|uniref:Uncharacterized protein n=1 Tax=Algibacter lectus TaxID=221126 RepID=A0A090VEA1_9FLAO|nr:hypothetical protein [Algibacter lectus]MWW25500.1 hypothetical protein [Algibacter lectus]TDY61445.1 hypothetical protein DFQ06_2779 [Algibacter lectus]GAL63110.1 hypothetical protein JCM19300_1128 [Algibacter lectus]GAL78147.1 hypothetical protein JCM19274_4646 [Algibacter lectus]
MGGEGSMMAANQSLKNNRSLTSKRKEKGALSGSYANIELKEFPKATQEQLDTIKAQTLTDNKKALIQTIVFFIIASLGLLIAVHYLF